MRAIPNVHLLGDIHYDDYPDVLKRWDIAWVPHSIGDNEMGGDAIKIYEYRAAGLPVVSTRIIGWERALPRVETPELDDVSEALAEIGGTAKPMSVPRDDFEMPAEHTWQSKTNFILDLLEV